MATNLVPRSTKKQKGLSSFIKAMIASGAQVETRPEDELLSVITKAHQELFDAENFFDNVIEDELVDHAIYRMEAAKSKYIFLLKKAKDKGLKVEM